MEEEELIVDSVEYVTYALIESNGDIITIGECLVEDVASQAGSGQIVVTNPPADVADDTHYYKNDQFKLYPTKPGDWAVFDYTTEAWTDPRPTDKNSEFSASDYTVEPEFTLSGNTLSYATFTATRINGVYSESKTRTGNSITFAGSPVLVAYNWDTNTVTTYANFAALNSAPRRFLLGEFRASDYFIPAANLVNGVVVAANTLGSVNIEDAAINAAKIANSAITATKLANGAVIRDKILDGAVESVKLANNAVTEAKIAVNAITEVKIANNAITTAKISPLAIEASKIANNAITETKIEDGAITTPKIEAGAVIADKIAANAITASKVALMDNTNLVADDQIQDASAWGGVAEHVTFNSTYGVTVPAAKSRGAWMVYRSATPTTATSITSKQFPARDGEEFHISITIGSTGPMQARAYLQFINISGSSIQPAVTTTYKTGGSFETLTASGVAPAGTATARIVLEVPANGYTDAGGHLVFAAPIIRRKAGAELIVDGAITADKLAANSVVAGKIASNAVTANTVAANAITSLKIAANTIQAGHITSEAIQAKHISANAVEANSIAANAVTTAKIQAGAVGADQIAAKAIIASKIAVVDFTNLISNGDFSEADLSFWAGVGGPGKAYWLTGPDYVQTGARSLILQKDAGSETASINITSKSDDANLIPVKAGEVLYAETAFKTNQTAQSAGAYFRILWFNADKVALTGGSTYTDVVNNAAIPTTWVKHSKQITVPAAAVFARIQLFNHSTNSIANLIFDRLILKKAAGAELIVDGAVTADKIAANSIAAIHISANSVNASHIVANSISSGKIAANSIAAIHISANSVNASHIVANTIGADHITADAITTGKIKAGAVGADQISAKAIVASHLMVSNWSNIIADGTMQDERSWIGITGNAHVSLSKNYGQSNPSSQIRGGAAIISRSATPAVNTPIVGEWIDCSPGEEYFASMRAGATHSGIRVFLSIQIGDSNKDYLGNFNSPVKTTNTFETLQVNMKLTDTSNARYVRLVMYVDENGYTPSGGHIVFGSPILKQKSDANVIVDGAITADKLNTTDLNVAGVGIFGGTLQSNNFNASTGTGWRIMHNGTMNMANAIIKTAHIDDLQVGTTKLADRAATAIHFANSNINNTAAAVAFNSTTKSKLIVHMTVYSNNYGAYDFEVIQGGVTTKEQLYLGNSLNTVTPDTEYTMVRSVDAANGANTIRITRVNAGWVKSITVFEAKK